MTKKPLFLYAIVVVFLVSIASYILNEQVSLSSPIQNSHSASKHAQSKLDANEHKSPFSSSEIESKEVPEEVVMSKTQEKGGLTTIQNSEQTHLTESTNQIKWGDVFNSVESAEAHFVNEEGHLLKSGLNSLFKAKDFDEVLDALDNVGTNEKSASRKISFAKKQSARLFL